MSLKPFVSVIVPVYNEEYLLPACLEALKQQDYDGPYEIVVVDNACTDRSPEIARAMGVRVVSEPRKGVVNALRTGFAATRGEIVACTDGDTCVPRDWLSRLVAALNSGPDVVAAGGLYIFHDASWWLRLLIPFFNLFNWHLNGSNLAVRRWAYEAIGGLDPEIILGWDAAIGFRLRRVGRVVLDRELFVKTSARSYRAFLCLRYALNYVWLALLGRPLLRAMPDIRLPPGRRPARGWLSGVAVLMIALGLFTFAAVSPGAQAFGPVFDRGQVEQAVVALTFDDGPNRRTMELLDILARYGVKATFFVVGEDVQQRPELARRIVAEGHAIGNHTYSHPLLMAAERPARIERELDEATEAIRAATGVTPTIFRPPHGWRSPWLVDLACRQGYTVVTWSVALEDGLGLSPETIAERVLNRVRPGAIILLAEEGEGESELSTDNAMLALPRIIEPLQARGYRFVTVPELIQMSAGLNGDEAPFFSDVSRLWGLGCGRLNSAMEGPAR